MDIITKIIYLDYSFSASEDKKPLAFDKEENCLKLFSRSRSSEDGQSPVAETFLMFPEDDESTFYLGLNHIVNSLRSEEISEHLLRKDDFLIELTKKSSLTTMTRTDFQICLYCLTILLKGCEKQCHDLPVDSHELFLQKLVDIQSQFIDSLDHEKEHNREHKPISPTVYLTFLKELRRFLLSQHKSVNYDKSLIDFWWMVTAQKRTLPPSTTDFDWRDFHKLLDGTSDIINECLEPYDNHEDSGHMAIIRTIGVEEGKQFKQSLCIAKMKAGLLKLEIIQDFNGKHTTLDKAINLAVDDARVNNLPEILRIPKRLQTDDCEKEKCSCSNYVPPEDCFSIHCENCNHIHKNLTSYKDLEKLPCILILVNKGQMGDTFPSSLIALDARVTGLRDSKTYYLTPFTQEKGRMCRYTSLKDKFPFIYLNETLYHDIEHSLKFDCSFKYYFLKNKAIDPKITLDDNLKQVTTKNHADSKLDHSKSKDRNFLLSAEPQCGKTGVYLNLIAEVRKEIQQKTVFIEGHACESVTGNEEGICLEEECQFLTTSRISELQGVPSNVTNVDNKAR